jgi:nitroreductase
MDALEAIRKRRTVREFTGDEVPQDVLEKIVDAGRLAATGRNRQPWEFIVVTDREMIKHFSIDIQWVEKSGAVIAVVMDPTSKWWVEDGSAAVENMLIAATALEYGSCWFGGYTHRRDEEFKTLLGVPEDKKLFTLVPIGVPINWPTIEKKPLEEVMRWEKY